MTCRPGRMTLAVRPPIRCPGVVPSCPGPVPAGVRVVREEDADALVADVMMVRAARGKDVTVTAENIVWLYRGAYVMLGAWEPGAWEEDDDD